MTLHVAKNNMSYAKEKQKKNIHAQKHGKRKKKKEKKSHNLVKGMRLSNICGPDYRVTSQHKAAELSPDKMAELLPFCNIFSTKFCSSWITMSIS